MMSTTLRWTISDLELFPDDGKRREIIDGELYVSTQPSWYHQTSVSGLLGGFYLWDPLSELGVATTSPGIIFSPDDAVAPDIVWISNGRLAGTLDQSGHLHVAPELVVEVLSPGSTNERRDREAKLKLYSARGVLEYWIVDGMQRRVEVYRRADLALALVATLLESDTLTSPLLPQFAYPLERLFARIPRH